SFGESKVDQRASLFALLLGAVGERPLGIQAEEVESVARLKNDAATDPRVHLVAVGPRCGLIALCAAALAPDPIASVTLHAPPGRTGRVRRAVRGSAAPPWPSAGGTRRRWPPGPRRPRCSTGGSRPGTPSGCGPGGRRGAAP